jgi:predicted anti-sigma-YlaC factor YlaD
VGRIDSSRCERAREWASVDLDGQLAELERALLRAHLERCEDCAEHVRALAATTAQLRFARLAQPELPPFAAPRRGLVSLRAVQTAAAAAAVAVAAGLGAALGVQGRPTSPAPAHAGVPAPSRIVDVTDHKLSALGRTYLRQSPAPGALPQ